MENRNALIVDAELTAATGYAERDTAVEMLARLPASKRRRTIAAGKAYDTRDFVARTRGLGFTPHVAQNTTNRRSATDGRTTRHPGLVVSQRIRKRLRNHSGGSRASAEDASFATSADNETGPGSRSKPPSTTSPESPPSTPHRADRHQERDDQSDQHEHQEQQPHRSHRRHRHPNRKPEATATQDPNFITLLTPVRQPPYDQVRGGVRSGD